jgi:hypothetical protein
METLWNRVRKSLVEWYETAYDKTDELAKIGKKKIEIAGVNRSIEKGMSELGGRVYHLITVEGHRGNKTADDEKVAQIVERISELEDDLKSKELEIERIREEKEASQTKEPEDTNTEETP